MFQCICNERINCGVASSKFHQNANRCVTRTNSHDDTFDGGFAAKKRAAFSLNINDIWFWTKMPMDMVMSANAFDVQKSDLGSFDSAIMRSDNHRCWRLVGNWAAQNTEKKRSGSKWSSKSSTTVMIKSVHHKQCGSPKKGNEQPDAEWVTERK